MNKPYSHFGQAYISFATYHHSFINQLIHLISVPLMTASVIAILGMIPFAMQVGKYTIGVADVAVAVMVIYFLAMNMTFAAGTIAIGAGLAMLWRRLFQGMDEKDYMKWVFAILILSSVLNIIGHKLFEKRHANILSNIIQAIASPIFMVVILMDILGIRSDEMQQWHAQVARNVTELQRKDEESGKHP